MTPGITQMLERRAARPTAEGAVVRPPIVFLQFGGVGAWAWDARETITNRPAREEAPCDR